MWPGVRADNWPCRCEVEGRASESAGRPMRPPPHTRQPQHFHLSALKTKPANQPVPMLLWSAEYNIAEQLAAVGVVESVKYAEYVFDCKCMPPFIASVQT